MIRGDVLKWAAIALLALFAFMLLPTYEYFSVPPAGGGGQSCTWPTPTPRRAPSDESMFPGKYFQTRIEAQTECDNMAGCLSVTRMPSGLFTLSNTRESREINMDVDFTEKPACATGTGGSGGSPSGTGGGSCPWPTPTAHRVPINVAVNMFGGQHSRTRSEAQTKCDENTDCKGVLRYIINGSDFFAMTRTAETENNDGDYDFAEKPTCAGGTGGTGGTGGGSSGGHAYSAGSSRSDPPVDNIARSDNADQSSGMLAGSGYGPGAMYGEGGRNSATPWFKGTDEDNYIAKSALVPCTCTTHSMGCAKHSGGRDQSKSPGDMDGSPNQYGIMKPFSSAFSNQEEPSGFLNTFNAFMR